MSTDKWCFKQTANLLSLGTHVCRHVVSPFSTLLFRCRRRKIMTAKLYFCVPSPLKKLVMALQSLKMSCFYFTFCSWSYKTTNKVSGWRNFSPATAKYVSGKRAVTTGCYVRRSLAPHN